MFEKSFKAKQFINFKLVLTKLDHVGNKQSQSLYRSPYCRNLDSLNAVISECCSQIEAFAKGRLEIGK